MEPTPNTQGASWEEIVDDYFEGRTNFVNASEYMKGLMRSIASKERAEGERRERELIRSLIKTLQGNKYSDDTPDMAKGRQIGLWMAEETTYEDYGKNASGDARTLPADSTEV